MPVKRKRGIGRSIKIGAEALARWREIRPAGIDVAGSAAMLTDDTLAEALGFPVLVPLPQVMDIHVALESAHRHERTSYDQ